jgi:hypothetical protein
MEVVLSKLMSAQMRFWGVVTGLEFVSAYSTFSVRRRGQSSLEVQKNPMLGTRPLVVKSTATTSRLRKSMAIVPNIPTSGRLADAREDSRLGHQARAWRNIW